MSGIPNPVSWPVWLRIILYPPMLIGAVSGWLPLAKAPKWRVVQIGCIVYFILFAIFVAWKSVIGYAIVAIAALGVVIFLFLRRQNSN